MRVIVALLFFACFSAFAADAKPSLLGAWKSDRALTMSFADSHNKLEPKTSLFWSQMVGRMTLRVSKREIRSDMEAWDAPQPDGSTRVLVGFSSKCPYKVVHSDQAMIVIVACHPITGEPQATTYNFVDADTFWVYTGRGGDESPGSHLREYFRRIK